MNTFIGSSTNRMERSGVRMGDWKAVRRDIDRTPQGSTELYNLKDDIGEKNNVASSNPEIVKKMEGIMKEAHTPSDVFPFAFETSKQ